MVYELEQYIGDEAVGRKRDHFLTQSEPLSGPLQDGVDGIISLFV